MHIKNLHFNKNRLSAQVDGRLVFFEFPKQYGNNVVVDYSPFLAAFLFPAMKKGQTLRIEGYVDRKLLAGCYRIMNVVSSWKIGLKPVSIEVKLRKNKALSPSAEAVFFSSGVDSFYTLLNRKKISHIISVHGFDTPLKNKKMWSSINKNIKSVANEKKVQYIEVRTNLREILDSYLPWGISHGGALASVGLCLRGLFKNVYISSSYYQDDLFPWGSHPDIDSQWSTAQLKYIHYGANKRRTEKVANISSSDIAMHHLRVCWINPSGKYNCGRCEKCIRTMINLMLVDRLKSSQTFPHVIDLNDVKKIIFHDKHDALFFLENLLALKVKDQDHALIDAMEYAYHKFEHPSMLDRLRGYLKSLDDYYFSNKIYLTYLKLVQSRNLRN